MQLTKGQKDALLRKVQQIVDAKRAEAQERYIKAYKPTAETVALLNKIKAIDKARNAYRKAVEDAGLNFNYSGIEYPIINASSICIYHNSDKFFYDYFSEEIMRKQLNKQAEKDEVRFPTYEAIIDDIELACLDKSFDMEAFLAKYNNL